MQRTRTAFAIVVLAGLLAGCATTGARTPGDPLEGMNRRVQRFNDALDSAAMSALKLSNPTMKLPDNYPGDVIDPFTVTFYYLARTP